MNTDYTFTDREHAYFDRLQAQFNSSVMSAISLIVTQQGLAGQWRMQADGTGIERVDLPPVPPPSILPPPKQDPDLTS